MSAIERQARVPDASHGAPLTPADLAGLRYCDYLGGTDFYVAASPSVSCGTASAVEGKVFSHACSKRTRCTACGFSCVSVRDGRYGRPFSTRVAQCAARARAGSRSTRA